MVLGRLHLVEGRWRATNRAAAKDARAIAAMCVKHAGLSRCDTFLPAENFDGEAICMAREQCLFRRAGGAHTRENLQPLRGQIVQLIIADPVEIAQWNMADRQSFARADNHFRALRIDAHHIKRLACGNAETATLPDGEADDAIMLAHQAAIEMTDRAGMRGFRTQFTHQFGIIAGRDEADILTVGLVGNGEADLARHLARFGFGHASKRKAQTIELILRGGEQEIALVAIKIGRTEQAAIAILQQPRFHIMAGGEAICAKVFGESEKVTEFDGAIAFHTGDRRLACRIAFDEAVDHLVAEAVLVIEHVMRNAKRGCDIAGILNVAPRAAGTGAMRARAMIVKLKRDANRLVAARLHHGGDDRGINPARHRDDNARFADRLGNVEIVEKHGTFPPAFDRALGLHKRFRPRIPALCVFWCAKAGKICRFLRIGKELTGGLASQKIKKYNIISSLSPVHLWPALCFTFCGNIAPKRIRIMVASVAVRPEASNGEAQNARLSRRPGEQNVGVTGFGESLQQQLPPRSLAYASMRSRATDQAARAEDKPKAVETQPKPRDFDDAASHEAAQKPHPKRDRGDAEPVKDSDVSEDGGTVCHKSHSSTSPHACAASEASESKPVDATAEPISDKSPSKDEILAVQTEFVPPSVTSAPPAAIEAGVNPETIISAETAELVPGYVEMLASAAGVVTQDAGADGDMAVAVTGAAVEAVSTGSGEAASAGKSGLNAAQANTGAAETLKTLAANIQNSDQAQSTDGETADASAQTATSTSTLSDSGEKKGIGDAVSDAAKAKNTEKTNGEGGKPAVNHARPAFAEWVSELAHAQGAIHRSGDLVGALDRMANPAASAQGQGEALRPTPLQMLPIEIGMQAMRGATQFQIRLDPAELGRVDVKLEIRSNGEVHANLVVDRVETLAMLKRDAQTLQYAFEQAGLKQSADGLTFSLRGEGQHGQHKPDGQGNAQGQQVADDDTLKLQNQISELAMRRVMIPHSSIDRVI